MKKSIIVIMGTADSGKSETIRKFYDKLVPDQIAKQKDKEKEICDIFTNSNYTVGFYSIGDPGHSICEDKNADHFFKDADIIICASRTRGATIDLIRQRAIEKDYFVYPIFSFHEGKDTKEREKNNNRVYQELEDKFNKLINE
ncbi:MAG: hypothetical protein AB7E39_05300 [Endomicrobiaceae bacterium]